MARIALVCPAFYSHVRAFEALSSSLEALGHETLFLMPAGAEALLRPGSRSAFLPGIGGRTRGAAAGILGILGAVRERARATDTFCRFAPDILKHERIDAIVADEFEPGAGLVADHLKLPHVSLAAALPIERDAAMPLPFLDWPYDASEAGLARNRGGELIGGFFLKPQRRAIERWAERFAIGARKDDVACLSRSLRLTQTVPGLDFPRPMGAGPISVGPIRLGAERASDRSLPFDRDPARPLVFASLGTVQGHRVDLFRRIAGACRDLGFQLLVAHCGALSEGQAARIDADRVTDFVDQEAVLALADICVTHGGLNTVLDCLKAEVPMLALPITYDQPGIGARILHHGFGEAIAAKRARRTDIRERLERLVRDRAGYAARIVSVAREIASAGGAARAARLIDDHLVEAVRGERERSFHGERAASDPLPAPHLVRSSL